MKRYTHRYNLVLGKETFSELQEKAKNEHRTFADIMRKCIKMGLWLEEEAKNGKKIILRDEKGEKEIIFL